MLCISSLFVPFAHISSGCSYIKVSYKHITLFSFGEIASCCFISYSWHEGDIPSVGMQPEAGKLSHHHDLLGLTWAYLSILLPLPFLCLLLVFFTSLNTGQNGHIKIEHHITM